MIRIVEKFIQRPRTLLRRKFACDFRTEEIVKDILEQGQKNSMPPPDVFAVFFFPLLSLADKSILIFLSAHAR